METHLEHRAEREARRAAKGCSPWGDTLAGDTDALGKGKMTAAAQSLAMVVRREVRDLGSVPQPPWLHSWHWVSLLAGEVLHILAQPGGWHAQLGFWHVSGPFSWSWARTPRCYSPKDLPGAALQIG